MNTIAFKDKLEIIYTEDHLTELEEIEKKCDFPSFSSLDALNLGMMVVQESEKYREEVAIQIVRMKDRNIIFQYIASTKTQRNIEFAQGKMNTVYQTKHCSLWALVKEIVDGKVQHIFSENSTCLPVAGAFPIYVGKEIVAVIGVSGLHQGNDQRVLLDAFEKYLKIKLPCFNGELI